MRHDSPVWHRFGRAIPCAVGLCVGINHRRNTDKPSLIEIPEELYEIDPGDHRAGVLLLQRASRLDKEEE